MHDDLIRAMLNARDDDDVDDRPRRTPHQPPIGPIVEAWRAVSARKAPPPDVVAGYTAEHWRGCEDAGALAGLAIAAGEGAHVIAAVRETFNALTACVNHSVPAPELRAGWQALRRCVWWIEHGQLARVADELARPPARWRGGPPDTTAFRRALRSRLPEPPPLERVLRARAVLRVVP